MLLRYPKRRLKATWERRPRNTRSHSDARDDTSIRGRAMPAYTLNAHPMAADADRKSVSDERGWACGAARPRSESGRGHASRMPIAGHTLEPPPRLGAWQGPYSTRLAQRIRPSAAGTGSGTAS